MPFSTYVEEQILNHIFRNAPPLVVPEFPEYPEDTLQRLKGKIMLSLHAGGRELGAACAFYKRIECPLLYLEGNRFVNREPVQWKAYSNWGNISAVRMHAADWHDGYPVWTQHIREGETVQFLPGRLGWGMC